jgi:ribonucleotide reductase alpha subunit
MNINVTKRDGRQEPFDANKINLAIERNTREVLAGTPDEDRVTEFVTQIATELSLTLFNGITTEQLDEAVIQVALQNVKDDPIYDQIASRLLLGTIYKKVFKGAPDFFTLQNAHESFFPHNIRRGVEEGLYDARFTEVYDLDWLAFVLDPERDKLLKYTGLVTLRNRYGIAARDGQLLETPQMFWMRVAMGLSLNEEDPNASAIEFYEKMSKLEYLAAGSTLVNAGTSYPQLSNCFVLEMQDDIEHIAKTVRDVMWLTKGTGGIGLSVTKLRAQGSPIRSNNTYSTGPIPFMHTIDSVLRAISRGGKKFGALAFYMENWHLDFPEFLELRNNSGDPYRRTRTANTAVWISDEFMKRVQNDQDWYLFDPLEVSDLNELYGSEFSARYAQYIEDAEAGKLHHFQKISAKEQFRQILITLQASSHPWLTWKDTINLRALNNNTGTIHSSNLCVAPETLILTDKGHLPIGSLEGKKVNVWNGEEFSTVEIKKTGEDQELITVTLDSGTELECTPYHKFYRENRNGKLEEVRASELNPGDKLIRRPFPIIEGGTKEISGNLAYTHGYYLGAEKFHREAKDNTTSRQAFFSYRHVLLKEVQYKSADALNVVFPDEMPSKDFAPTADHTLKDRLAWLSGIFDAGLEKRKSRTGVLPIWSLYSDDADFLVRVKLVLQTLGADAKIKKNNDDLTKRGNSMRITYPTLSALVELGLPVKRVELPSLPIKRRWLRNPQVVSVKSNGRISDTFCFTEPLKHMGVFNGILTGQCTEITLPQDRDNSSVCNLASINLPRHLNADNKIDLEKLQESVRLAVRHLDNLIDITVSSVPEADNSNSQNRAIGLGVMGLTDVFERMGVAYDSDAAYEITDNIVEFVSYYAIDESTELAQERGSYPNFEGSGWSKGMVPIDTIKTTEADRDYVIDVPLTAEMDWDFMREKVKEGMRNATLMAIAPTASIGLVAGTTPGLDPQFSQIFSRSTSNGKFLEVNVNLVNELKGLGLWESVKDEILRSQGDIQNIESIPDSVKAVYKTSFQLSPYAFLKVAARAQKWIDQAISRNMYLETRDIDEMADIYTYAWQAGVKTTYYLHTKPRHTAEQSTVKVNKAEAISAATTPESGAPRKGFGFKSAS